MKYLFFSVLIVFSSCHGTKISSTNKLLKESHQFTQLNSFEIRSKPILNREYIIFLCWYLHVYGTSYPDKVLEILPENSLNVKFYNGFEFESLFSNINPNSILKNYILNPEFLNYPLIGLSEFQVMELENWMFDRYNESSLIKNGYLNFNLEQKDEDCFTTEAFLVEQYMGDVKKEYHRDWNKNEFKSIFRLPYSDELIEILKEDGVSNDLIEYPFNSEDFLWLWKQQYFSSNNNQDTLTLKVPYRAIQIFNFNRPDEILEKKYSSAFLTNRDNEFINTEYLKPANVEPYPYPEKEFYGIMKFVVVGTNDKSQPIIADRIKSNKNNKMENRIFRIVSNIKIDKKYWP